jgi:hypothetical protein
VTILPHPAWSKKSPHPREFRAALRRIAGIPDCVAERGEFELPVPICEQSDDGIRLRFATSRRTAKRYQPRRAFLVRFRGS